MPRLYNTCYGKKKVTITEDNGSTIIKKLIRTDPSIRSDMFPVEQKRIVNGVMTNHSLYSDSPMGKGFEKVFDNGKLVLVERFKQIQHSRRTRHGIGFNKNAYSWNIHKLLCDLGIGDDSTILHSRFEYSYGKLKWVNLKYKNGKLAYKWSEKDRKPLVVYSTLGKVMAIVQNPTKEWGIEHMWGSTYTTFYGNGNRLKEFSDGINVGHWKKDGTVIIAPVYDGDKPLGTIENRQRTGEWIIDGEHKYFIGGVPISKDIYEKEPSDWDSNEVLSIQNAQMRAALLSRMGYEKLLKDTEAVIEHKDGDMELYNVRNPKGLRADSIIKLLKVRCPSTGTYYVLRVPPEVTQCEQARQWTFHKDVIPSWRNRETPEEHITFTKET